MNSKFDLFTSINITKLMNCMFFVERNTLSLQKRKVQFVDLN